MKNPLIIFNPKDEEVEFMYDHLIYRFQPGEKKLMEWDIAKHGLSYGCGLTEYTGDIEDGATSGIAYDKMPWKKVVSIASKRGLFKPGMSKKAVLEALGEADEQGA